jgi:GH35 family endo-1,4-beta-xylanase
MNRHLLRSALLCAALQLAACGDNNGGGNSGDNNPPPPPPPENSAPIADAGPDQTIPEGYSVILTLGPGTEDSDGTIASYKWRQIAGPQVELNENPNDCPEGHVCGEVLYEEGTATFIAPATELPIALEFQLTVTDDDGAESAPDSVTITVEQIKFFGTAPGGENTYQHLLRYFDQLTPENAGKWASAESERNQMNWAELDTAYNFAQNHSLRFKFHTLIWGQQQPAWLDELTPVEQLAEIDEWMAAVAERYPQLDMIDVVNEPLHAPPAYKEALGGDGESGWDWLITSFEMARTHFPDSRLILNDYNILILPQFTQDYLEVIEMLHARGLLDGIGVQAHFLERTEAAVVQANLDALAATGLPIYVSELDLNFADDAQQANVMRDLFSVFWQHPTVAGITHWGHLQGTMWRENGYLLRADGSERPALQWLTCYMAGESGCDLLVPEYVPAGWSGGEYSLTLEAELYDQGQGLIAAGSQVAYTDDGDWILFRSVEFQQGWDSFWVNYSKGNEEVGSISIHLDSLESEPVLTVSLEPTADWNSFATLELPWAQLQGTHDLYIRFNDAEGVANIDWLRIGKPQPVSDSNLVMDGGFEGSSLAGGWFSENGNNLELTSEKAKEGEQSLRASGSSTGAIAVNYELVDSVTPGATYAVSAWALHTQQQLVYLDAYVKCELGGVELQELDRKLDLVPGEWTLFSGELAVPDCEASGLGSLEKVLVTFAGPWLDEDDMLYIDEVEVVLFDPNLVADGGFEGATHGWTTWWSSGTQLELTGEKFHTGAQSLHASNRTDSSRPAYALTSLVSAGSSYAVSAWAQHTGAAPDTLRLSAKVQCNGGAIENYPWIQNREGVEPDTWSELSGTLEIPPGCETIGEVLIYFEGTGLGADLYVDDVSVTAQ